MREVQVLPMGVVKVRLGPKRLIGREVDRRISDGEFPRPVERQRGVAEVDLQGTLSDGKGLSLQGFWRESDLGPGQRGKCADRQEDEGGAESSG